jgi:hypothetical protein
MRLSTCATLVLTLLAAHAKAAGPDALPILEKKCAGCHGAAKMSGLDLRDRQSALRGGNRGPAVIPGKPDQSRLFTFVSGKGEVKMPPGKESLSADEIGALRAWIVAGAPWSNSSTSGAAPAWWSFQPVARPSPPQHSSHAIDAFIISALEAKGLTPAPKADRHTLIRRAWFDLVGLPPPPDQVRSFVNDTAPDAWQKAIDGLLASPQYGERWGRHWLDVARYADSGGYETDIYYKNAWRYRDYVIQSFNDDKPYDRFVQEQVAGDEIWPDNLDLGGTYEIPKEKLKHLQAWIGTGLYTLGPEVHESNMDARKLQYEKLTDWVDTTGSAFLGLTFGCARCHDHKFDPISQRDYYRLAAIFAYSTETEVPVVHRMSIRDHGQHYPRVVAVAEAKTAYRMFEDQVRKRIVAERKKNFSPAEVAAYDTKEADRTAEQKQLAENVAAAVKTIRLDQEMSQDEAARKKALLESIAKAVLAIPDRDAQKVPWDGIMDIPTATVLAHREPELVPETATLKRGELSQSIEKVRAGLPGFLGGADIASDDCSGRCIPLARKQLALWLTRPEHPLTARVMMNRIWHWHFGRGLVGTPNDFGRQGQLPAIPELLDWLASEFVANGWSIKSMHRLIMTSEAYQRASAFRNQANEQIDPDNRLLWRMNRRRLEGEALWDAMHSAAGTLNLASGGRPVAPPLAEDEISGMGAGWQWPVSADPAEHTRRGVYLLVRRNFPYPMFEAFDGPINSVSCPARDTTSVAPQALWFLNNRVVHEQARQFANRLRKQTDDSSKWPEIAFNLALGRDPSDAERAESETMIRELGLERLCLSLFNLNEFAFVD